jgi:hypothetical protein
MPNDSPEKVLYQDVCTRDQREADDARVPTTRKSSFYGEN